MKLAAAVFVLVVARAVGYQSCKSANQPDVLLVVEDSAYLPEASVLQLQAFLAEIANNFNLESDAARVGYQQYSNANKAIFELNTYGSTNDARSKILQTGFSRRDPAPIIADSLNFAWTDELSVTNGERSCHPTVVILVSYSSYEDPNGLGDPDPYLIANDLTAVRRLKNSGALVIVVGVGSKRNPQHLLELASGPAFYHDYGDFSDLSGDEADAIATQACNYVPDGAFYPCEMRVIQADFVFIVDVTANFKGHVSDVTTFINNTLRPYNYDHKSGVQAALVTYQKDADIQINFGDYDTAAEFVSAANTKLSNIDCSQTDRCVDDALDKVSRHVLVEERGFRDNCTSHIVFVFTSDCFNCRDPIPLANSIRALPNTEIFVVPLVQTFGFWKEYLEIADDASHLWEAQADPTNILSNYLHKQAWRSVCQSFVGAKCPLHPATTTTVPFTTNGAPEPEPQPVRRGPHQMRP